MILKHPNLPGVTARVDDHLVEIWQRSGWQVPEPEAPAPPAPKRRPRRPSQPTERPSNG